MTASPLARQLSPDAPLDLEAQFTVSKVPLQPRGGQAELFRCWRDRGGALSIVLVRLDRADAKFEATGEVKLDAERRPEGRIEVSLENLDAIVAGLGIEVPGFALPILKKGKAPLNLGGGRLSFGPVPLMPLKPLY